MSTRRRWPSRLATLAGLVLVAVGAARAWQTLAPTTDIDTGETPLVDMSGQVVRLDPNPEQPAQPAPTLDTTTPAGRFVVTSVGLDIPLDAMRENAGWIIPPGFTSAYHLTNRGVALDHASDGTVYVAMHSLRHGGLAPGNYLFDVTTGTSKAEVGAVIKVNNLTYVVESTMTIHKLDLPKAADLWADVPGRLVIITCLQKPNNTASESNFVIVAHLAGVNNSP